MLIFYIFIFLLSYCIFFCPFVYLLCPFLCHQWFYMLIFIRQTCCALCWSVFFLSNEEVLTVVQKGLTLIMHYICIISFDPGIPKHQEALAQSHAHSPQHGVTLTVAEWNFKVMSCQWSELQAQCWLMQYEGTSEEKCKLKTILFHKRSVWVRLQFDTKIKIKQKHKIRHCFCDPDASTRKEAKLNNRNYFFEMKDGHHENKYR